MWKITRVSKSHIYGKFRQENTNHQCLAAMSVEFTLISVDIVACRNHPIDCLLACADFLKITEKIWKQTAAEAQEYKVKVRTSSSNISRTTHTIFLKLVGYL